MVSDRLAPRELLRELPRRPSWSTSRSSTRAVGQAGEIYGLIVERDLAGLGLAASRAATTLFGRGFEEARPVGLPVAGHGDPRALQPGGGAGGRRNPGHPPARRPRVHGGLGAPPAGSPEVLVDWAALGRLRGTLLLMMAVENAPHRRRPGRRRPRGHTPVAVVCDGSMPGERTVLSTLGGLAADLDQHGVRPPAIIVVGDVVAVAHPQRFRRDPPGRDRRPRRPAAGRLPRPARRRAAHPPRGRARAVPRRGREGRPPRGRGRLPAPLVPDGAAVAGRAGRRARSPPTRPATSSARRWPSRSPASTSTAAPSPRWSDGRCRASTRCSPALGRCWCSRTSSTTRNVGAVFRSGAAFGFDAVLLSPRCADPLYRRSIKVAMGAVFSPPWTRLPDWYDALPDLSARGFTTVALTLADDAVARRGRRGRGRPGGAGAGLRGPRAVGALGAAPPTAGRSSRCAGHRLAQRRRRHRRRLLRHHPPL